MLLKSLTRKQHSGSVKQLLEYVLQDHKRGCVVRHNIEGSTIQEYIKAFQENERNRLHYRKNSITVYHEIISFHSGDTGKITPAILEDFARKYVELRNPNALILIVAHEDTESLHYHAIVSGTEIYTGRSSRVPRIRFKEIKQSLQEFHRLRYPELKHSIVNFDKQSQNKISEKEYQLKKRTNQLTEREETKQILELQLGKSISFDDFIKRLHTSGLQTYSRNGKITGIIGKRKMRFTNLGINFQVIQDKEDLMKQFAKLREHPNHRQNSRTWER